MLEAEAQAARFRTWFSRASHCLNRLCFFPFVRQPRLVITTIVCVPVETNSTENSHFFLFHPNRNGAIMVNKPHSSISDCTLHKNEMENK